MAIQFRSVTSPSATSTTRVTTGPASVQSAGAPQSTSEATTVKVSKPAELLAKLQKLKESDPEKLKSVLADVSKQLKDAAAKDGDEHLAKLAERFSTAAATGDLSSLAERRRDSTTGPPADGPPPGPPPGGAPRGPQGLHGAGPERRTARSDIDAILSKAIDSIDTALDTAASKTR